MWSFMAGGSLLLTRRDGEKWKGGQCSANAVAETSQWSCQCTFTTLTSLPQHSSFSTWLSSSGNPLTFQRLRFPHLYRARMLHLQGHCNDANKGGEYNFILIASGPDCSDVPEIHCWDTWDFTYGWAGSKSDWTQWNQLLSRYILDYTVRHHPAVTYKQSPLPTGPLCLSKAVVGGGRERAWKVPLHKFVS